MGEKILLAENDSQSRQLTSDCRKKEEKSTGYEMGSSVNHCSLLNVQFSSLPKTITNLHMHIKETKQLK